MKASVVAVVWSLTWLSFPLPLANALDVPQLPDAVAPVSGSLVVLPEAGIQVITHRGEWGAFFGSGGGGESFFLIAGEFENTSGKPLTYVKMQFELLNKDGTVVLRDFGYNRKAEALREEEYENGKKTLADMKIEQLPAGAKEGFRFFFFKSDAPEFRSYRVRFLEIR
ncbi:MAG: DUF3426 domain-containing protein [Deltaproteobacteria bacterium]|nr:DUF3426 domain-containing protein [Deltaproteobacteria bacterium]